MHRYQAGEEDRRHMLAAVGAGSIEELFASVPADVRIDHLDLPGALSEEEVRRQLWELATANAAPDCFASFLGAGVYRHVVPSVVDSLLQRGEFFTAYTPYQPEVSQGTLQAIFEFQTFVCQLSGLEVANASMYDGATAAVEAVLMANRLHPGRRRVVASAALHPEVIAVLRSYCEPAGLDLDLVPWDDLGRVATDALDDALSDEVCAVVVQSPNVFGVIEDLGQLGPAIKAHDAKAVQVVLEATSLGLLKPGGDFSFDVVCGELQAFGVPPSFGGPYLGFFAARKQALRQLPGRLVGQTVDTDGKRGYVLTLSTREQHIRRAKATSNICTNHGLMALAATITLSLLGRRGVREVAQHSHSLAEYVKNGIRNGDSALSLAFPDSPTYNEFLVLHEDPDGLLARLEKEGVLGGVSTQRPGWELPSGVLIAATEKNTREECDRLLATLGRLA